MDSLGFSVVCHRCMLHLTQTETEENVVSDSELHFSTVAKINQLIMGAVLLLHPNIPSPKYES